MVLGRAHQPPQRRIMDFACHALEAIRQEKTTTETGQRDTTKNHGRLGGIFQTLGTLQKQPCHIG